MNKTIFLIAFTLIGISSLFSQPVYQSSDYASPGDSFLVSSAVPWNLDYITAGTGVTWDFSSLVPFSQSWQQYQHPDSTGYQGIYVTACITACVLGGGGLFACINSCNNTWDTLSNLSSLVYDSFYLGTLTLKDVFYYYRNDTDGVEARMFTATISGLPFIVEYDRPDRFLAFPLQYGNPSDTSESSYVLDLTGLFIPFIYRHHQTRISTVEGWGSIITPYAQFDSAIKVRSLIYTSDTMLLGADTIALNPAYPSLHYDWVHPSQGIPVLTADGIITATDTTVTSVAFIDSARCFNPLALFGYLPVPVYIDTLTDSVEVGFFDLSANADSLYWDFGDPGSGSDNYSSGPFPYHWYTATGTYQVMLTACNTVCQPPRCDTVIIPVAVLDSTCVLADFSWIPASPCPGSTVTFLNFSMKDTAWYWDFGNGDTSTAQTPSTSYPAGGSYNVTLTAYGPCGADTVTHTLEVTSAFVDAGNDTVVCADSVITLYAAGGPGAGIFIWSPAAGLSCTWCQSPAASPDTTTTYIVTGIFYCGTATDTITVSVDAQPPQAGFGFTVNGLNVDFTDSSVSASGWQWDFGDGNYGSGQTVNHIYFGPGTYDVTLTASNSCGTDSLTLQVPVTSIGLDETDKPVTDLMLYPNPLTDASMLLYRLNRQANIRMEIYNVLGERILRFADEEQAPGAHQQKLNVRSGMSPGIYMLKMQVNRAAYMLRMTVLP